jgi:hypothetical protein
MDRELETDPREIADHLDVCPKCSQVVSAYRQIDRGIAGAHETTVPAMLTETVKKRCHSLPAVQPPAPSAFPTWAWRAAAVLALVLAITALVAQRRHERRVAADQPSRGETALVEGHGAQPGGPVDPSGGLSLDIPASLALGGPVPTGVQVTDLTPVGGDVRTFRIGNGQSMQPVPRAVRHVWLVADAQWRSLENDLEKEFPEADWSRDAEQSSLVLSLPDTALQALVDRLDSRGAALVSGTPPQPRQARSTAFTGRNVDYRMVFITQE